MKVLNIGAPANWTKLNNTLAELYGLREITYLGQLGGLSSSNYEVQAEGRHFVLKQYRSITEEDIEQIERISLFLQSHHLPVLPPMLSLQKQRHFIFDVGFVALYPKTEGDVLHGDMLSEAPLQAAAQLLARFHRLNPSSIVGLKYLTQRILSRSSIEQNADQILSLIAQRSLGVDIDYLTKELIHAKLDFLKQFFSEDLFSPYLNATHLVHGDFHNENLLFDTPNHNEIVRLLDFEETHLGHRVEDVMHFILLACCNSGYGKNNLKKAQVFLRAYSSDFPLSTAEIIFGVHLELFKEFSSFFLERSLFESRDLFFAKLIERDIRKVSYFRKDLNTFLNELTS